jgi:hypothetical protein
VLDSQRATQAAWGLVQSVRACGKGTHLDLRVLWDAVTVSGRLGCTTCDSCVLANDKAVLDSQRATQAAWGLVQSVRACGKGTHLEVRVLRVAVMVSGRLDYTTCGTCVLANDQAVLDSQRATQAAWVMLSFAGVSEFSFVAFDKPTVGDPGTKGRGQRAKRIQVETAKREIMHVQHLR